jgi:uridine kinase
MRAAVMIAGYLRSIELNLQSLHDKILSRFESVDIYLHITTDEGKQDRYNNNMTAEKQREIKEVLRPMVVVEESTVHAHDDPARNSVYNTWIKFHKLNLLKSDHESRYGKYDIVVKYRPDMNICSDIDFGLPGGFVYIPKDSKIDRHKLARPGDGHCCDIFAYGDSESMDRYFSISENLGQILEEVGSVPETVMHRHLYSIPHREVDVEYSVILSKCNVFAICGDSGSGKTTLGHLLERQFSGSFMFECDRYHKWERGNENWKVYSHLNPEANYLTKMSQDIFDLKVGRTIHQVDYDHRTGRFTSKKMIEASDNIIVCGLHSLYQPNDRVYDMKIFMDTHPELKRSWKVKRDTSERGHEIGRVMEQIRARELDFEEFILPQRDKSDLIVNFHTEDTFDESDPGRDLSVSLNILVNKRFDISRTLNQLTMWEIPYRLESPDDFNKISFACYKKSQLFGDRAVGNLYDYIVLVIMGINQHT